MDRTDYPTETKSWGDEQVEDGSRLKKKKKAKIVLSIVEDLVHSLGSCCILGMFPFSVLLSFLAVFSMEPTKMLWMWKTEVRCTGQVCAAMDGIQTVGTLGGVWEG